MRCHVRARSQTGGICTTATAVVGVNLGSGFAQPAHCWGKLNTEVGLWSSGDGPGLRLTTQLRGAPPVSKQPAGAVNDRMFLATGFVFGSAWGARMNREGAPVLEESWES